MNQECVTSRRRIEQYPDAAELRPSWLALSGHPVLQGVRLRNHRLAEGIDGP
jgi:hypothetical protein